MKVLLSLTSLLFSTNLVLSQTIPDFTLVDTDGNTHKIYEDYLNEGTTLVIKMFFVDCPPCNSLAPEVQDLYVKWGEGQFDVQFIEVSTRSRDTDDDIKGYSAKHGITFPGVSHSGGGDKIIDELRSGAYGNYFGTPSFVVIAPDGSGQLNYSGLNTIDDWITATGATGMEEVAETTNFEININWHKDFQPKPDSLIIELRSADEGSSYDLKSFLNGNTISFPYPNEDIPLVERPKLHIAYKDAASSANNLNGADVILLRKHILGLKLFENEENVRSADTNLDGRINGSDVIILRKVILGNIPDFRNGGSGYFPLKNNVDLLPDPGNIVQVAIRMLKMGDFN